MRARRPLTLLIPVLLVTLMPTLVAASPEKPTRAERKAEKDAIKNLPQKYRDWLETVDLLISEQELATFLALEKDYQRDAFIKQFWEARNPYKTLRNTFQERWEQKVAEARSLFGSLQDDRARMLLLNGPPAGWSRTARASSGPWRSGTTRAASASTKTSWWCSTATGGPGRSASGTPWRAWARSSLAAPGTADAGPWVGGTAASRRSPAAA